MSQWLQQVIDGAQFDVDPVRLDPEDVPNNIGGPREDMVHEPVYRRAH